MKKNSNRDGGSNALYAAFTVDTLDMVYIVDMVYTVEMVYTVDWRWMDGTYGSYPLDC